MQAHAHDLREEVTNLFDPDAADAFVHAIAGDWRRAELSEADQALCTYAEKLTRHQHDVGREDVERLRGHGFDDVAIHDATQIIGYFNYITRVADGLGVEPEDFIEPWGLASA